MIRFLPRRSSSSFDRSPSLSVSPRSTVTGTALISLLTVVLVVFTSVGVFFTPVAWAQTTPPASPTPSPTLSVQERQELEQLRTDRRLRQLIEANLENNATVQDRIELEVDRAFERTTGILNILLAVLTSLPIIAALGLWLLRRSVISELVAEVREQLEKEVYGELKNQKTISIQEIEEIQAEALTQLKSLSADAQAVLDELKEQINIANQEIDILKSEATTQIESMVSDAQGVKNQTILELTGLLPGSPQEQISPEVKPRIGILTQFLDSLRSAIPQVVFTASDHFRQGSALFFEGRYEDAIAAYDKALQAEPDYAEAWFSRGSTLAILQQYDEALTAYETAAQLQPESYEVWLSQGNVFRKLNRWDDAIAAYDQAIQLKPDDYRAWYSQGVVQTGLEQYEAALAAYEEVIRLKPDFQKVWVTKAQTLQLLQLYVEALTACDRAIALKSDDADAWYCKAVCHSLQKEPELTMGALQQAIDLNPAYREKAIADNRLKLVRAQIKALETSMPDDER